MRRSGSAPTAAHRIFDGLFRGLALESVVDPNHPNQLRFDTWDGRKAKKVNSARVGETEFSPATIGGGIARAVCFPPPSKSFGSAPKLAKSIRDLFSHYARVSHEIAAVLTAFALASWFVDYLPVAPLLFLLGDELQASLVLRLLGAVCRRSILLADVDIAALRSLPGGLNATLLINHRDLPQGVTRFLLASADPHFLVATGTNERNTCGAKALSAHGESANGKGLYLSLSPQLGPFPPISDVQLREFANDFQARLLRYRQIKWQLVRDAQPETGAVASALHAEHRAWMAPLSEFTDLRNPVLVLVAQRSRELEGERLTDDRCLVAAAALSFCHTREVRGFFVGQLTQKVNDLLQGRHEDHFVTHRKVGSLLKELGIEKDPRVAKGYRVFLNDSVRSRIHDQARAYGVMPTGGDVGTCSLCIEKERQPN